MLGIYCFHPEKGVSLLLTLDLIFFGRIMILVQGFMDNQCTLACQVCEKFIDASETIVAVAGGDSSSSSSSSSSSTDEFVDL